jgi:Tat protein translocase TatB subunit
MIGPVGGSEFVLILALALLLFGPRKLPQLGRSLGRALAEFRGATQEFKATLEREVAVEEVEKVRKDLGEARREVSETVSDLTRLGVPRGSLDKPGDGPQPGKDSDGTGGEPKRD